jgi:hypothetical protein
MADAADKLKFAGDVNIDKVIVKNRNGLTQNITGQVIGIEYFEDLFSSFITGHVIIKDSLDLMNLFKFMGEEYVEIEFSTPTMDRPIKNTFYVHKMTDRHIIGDRNVVFELHFISPEAIVDANKKVSKVFKGKYSEIVQELLTDTYSGLETKKRINIEDCSNRGTFISNYWSPTKNINWCCSKAETQRGCPVFVFYENNNGFNFVTLDALNSNDIKQAFTHDKYTRDDIGGGRTVMNIEEDYARILDLTIPESYDYLKSAKSGMFASRAMSFDITKKTYTAKNFNIFSAMQDRVMLNPNAPQSSTLIFRNNAALLDRPRMTANFSGTGDNSEFASVQHRISALMQANMHKIEITVPGRTDYCVGQKIAVKLNKMEPFTSQEDDADMIDKMYSGFYLISAINHSVTREKHECHMELIKDSLQTSPNQVGTN